MHVEIIFSPERKEKSAGCYFILGSVCFAFPSWLPLTAALGFLFYCCCSALLANVE